jgi:GNAT superfamily N-acetyltransferase
MNVSVIPVSSRTDDDVYQLRQLTMAVYPTDAAEEGPGARMEWASTEVSVVARTEEDAQIVAHAGVLARRCLHNGQPVMIGGIGGVKTHPDMRDHGLGRLVMTRATEILRDEFQADFGLLVCPSTAEAFYRRLGWREFKGVLLVEQPSGRIEFRINTVMVLPLRSSAPETGTIDLAGLPW